MFFVTFCGDTAAMVLKESDSPSKPMDSPSKTCVCIKSKGGNKNTHPVAKPKSVRPKAL